MKTLKQQWYEYTQHVFPVGATDKQIAEGKISFYGGAAMMLHTVTAGMAGLEQEEGVAELLKLRAEIKAFQNEYVRTGVVP